MKGVIINGKPVAITLMLTEDDAIDLRNFLLRQYEPRKSEDEARVRIGHKIDMLLDHFP